MVRAADTLRMRHAAAAMLLCASIALAGQPAPKNLWVGVLTYTGAASGEVASNSGGDFEPVGALVDGTWHFEREGDPDQGRLAATYGRTPPQWLPVGRVLPRAWRAWLTDGRTTTFELTGPFRPAGVWDTERVAVSIALPAGRAHAEAIAGVAVAGDARVHPFVPFSDDVDADHNDTPPEVLHRAMVNVEMRELVVSLPQNHSREESRRLLSAVTLTSLARARYGHTKLRKVTTPDGTFFTVFEGSKGFGAPNGCGLHSGGAMAETPAGHAVVLGAWSYLNCNELVVDHIPLAVIARGGLSCWLFKYQYEDGARLVLRPPGRVDYLKDDSACDIR